MKNNNKLKHIRSRLIYTIVSVLLLIITLLSMTQYIYDNAEREAFETLHTETKEIKDSIRLQMISDRENLLIMADFAANLYANREDFREVADLAADEKYKLLFDSFEAIGLLDNIGILAPDNRFFTKKGEMIAQDISFETEAKKAPYISGRVKDITDPEREVVRSAVPIIYEKQVIGILYGVIGLDTLNDKYEPMANSNGAKLYIVERGNGNLIVDTRNQKLGNFGDFKERKHREGFPYQKLYDDIMQGNNGYSSYIPKNSTEYHYSHYSSLELSDWQIMLAKPESVVFKKTKETERTIFVMFGIIVLIMTAYLVVVLSSDRKQNLINRRASKIRKLLLEINQHYSSISESLANIANFAGSRSAFFVDSEGEEYHYIIPSQKDNMLTGADRAYFLAEFMKYCGRHLKDRNVTVGLEKIVVNSTLKKESPDFYKFLKNHDIRRVCVAGIANVNVQMSLLGVINPKRFMVTRLLFEEIAVCFAMAIHNKKYLTKTETVAVTDSLTGLSNRLAYKKDTTIFDDKQPERFSCVYVDVNELHIINNKFGHAAGDAMLLYIANTLKEIFAGSHIYRMGGDEFLVFTENVDKDYVEKAVGVLHEKVAERNYHISVGVDFREKNIDTEALVKEAEKRMYEAKAEYYQKKEQKNHWTTENNGIEHVNTGIREFDSVLSIISTRYHGVYCVSLKNDLARRILMPSYFKQFSEENDKFSKVFSTYVHEMVNPDYHRPLLNFLKYDVLKRQLMEGNTPTISYVNSNGTKVMLSVYALPGQTDDVSDTMWVFERND